MQGHLKIRGTVSSLTGCAAHLTEALVHPQLVVLHAVQPAPHGPLQLMVPADAWSQQESLCMRIADPAACAALCKRRGR